MHGGGRLGVADDENGRIVVVSTAWQCRANGNVAGTGRENAEAPSDAPASRRLSPPASRLSPPAASPHIYGAYEDSEEGVLIVTE